MSIFGIVRWRRWSKEAGISRRLLLRPVYGERVTGRANDRVFAMSLAMGDRIRFNVKKTDLEVVNGTTGYVTSIVPDPNPMITSATAFVGNREISFTLAEFANDKDQVGLSWSHARTIFSAQGLTVDETLVLADAGFDRSAAYVAFSRARNRTTLFVDRSSLETLEQFEPGHPISSEACPSALTGRCCEGGL